MTITHIQLLSLPVSDQNRAKAFYVDTLGLDLLGDNDHIGPTQRWVQVGRTGEDTSITLVNWFDSMPAGSMQGLVLETDDLDGDVATLTRRGVAIDSDIQDAPWGRYVVFHDPDGNSLVLQATADRAH